jgi:hypothetical protein
MSSLDCRIPGDPDILGLGVRLGLYFQFFGNLLIGIIRPREGVSSLAVSNVLLAGMFVAVIYSFTVNNLPASSFLTTQWFLLLDAQLLVPVLIMGERVDMEDRLSFWSLSFFLFRWIAWNALNLWFWFKGLDIHNEAQCMEPRAFLFANLGAYGNVRTAFKVFTAMAMVYSAYALYIWLMSFLRRAARDGPHEERWKVVLDEEMDFLKDDFVAYICFATGMFGLAFTVAAIELEVRWNNVDGITGVQTTGQLIPLVVGCISLFRSLVLLLAKLWD